MPIDTEARIIIAVLLFFAILVPVITAWVWFERRFPRKKQTGLVVGTRLRWSLTALCALEGLAGLYGVLVEPNWLEVHEVPVTVAGLPFEIRIAQLSDLHLEPGGSTDSVLEALAAANPDLIALTGDFIAGPDAVAELETFLSRLIGLVGRQSIFAVAGNFEVEIDAPELFHKLGIPLLDGDVIQWAKGSARLQLAGLSFEFEYDSADWRLMEMRQRLAADLPAVLLYHAPDLAESPGIEAFDLVLTGHTHGGQVRLPWYGAVITLSRHGRKYQDGLYRLNDKTKLYVSRGIGSEVVLSVPFRFLCRPELPVFVLQPPPP